jgi:hypothetical protein
MKKYLSRKFLLALAGLAITIIAMVLGKGEDWTKWAVILGLMMPLAFIVIEGVVDRVGAVNFKVADKELNLDLNAELKQRWKEEKKEV